jgi:hypothetical protein
MIDSPFDILLLEKSFHPSLSCNPRTASTRWHLPCCRALATGHMRYAVSNSFEAYTDLLLLLREKVG